MILLLDNYDSFTYNLVHYFEELGIKCVVFRNDDPFEEIVKLNYSGVVISAGPEVPKKAGKLLKILEWYAGKLPILGICLGHQAIGQFYGATLVKASKPMHGKVCPIRHNNDILFKEIPKQLNVVRYNSLLVNDLPVELRIIATSNTNEVMALRHKELPLWGVQFHPEAVLTEHGLKILKNWLVYNDIT